MPLHEAIDTYYCVVRGCTNDAKVEGGKCEEHSRLTTRAERVRDVERLREQLGRKPLQREVANALGISRSYAAGLMADPTGDGDRARKESYRGVCENCGGPTSGGEGPAHVARVCKHCNSTVNLLIWTQEKVVDAIRRFAAQHGRPPTSIEWNCSDPENDYPAATTVYGSNDQRTHRPFDSWADAIEAAGFPRPTNGRRLKTEQQRGEPGMSSFTRDYIIFEVGRNGSETETFTVRAVVDAKNNAEALEKAEIETEGEYASVPIASLQRFRLRAKFVAERQAPRA